MKVLDSRINFCISTSRKFFVYKSERKYADGLSIYILSKLQWLEKMFVMHIMIMVLLLYRDPFGWTWSEPDMSKSNYGSGIWAPSRNASKRATLAQALCLWIYYFMRFYLLVFFFYCYQPTQVTRRCCDF